MQFTIGLTDIDNLDNFKYFEGSDQTLDNFAYNLYTQSSADEKASITWNLNDYPAVKNAVSSYNSLKTKPHFTIINYAKQENRLLPSVKDINCMIEVSGLLPSSNIFEDYTSEDYDNLIGTQTPFGSLTLDVMTGYKWAGIDDYDETINYAFANDSLDNLSLHTVIKAAPSFNINFSYNPQITNRLSTKMSSDRIIWIEKNKDKLTELGYNTENLKWGTIIFGNLVGDAQEAYEKINKYSKICRISIE